MLCEEVSSLNAGNVQTGGKTQVWRIANAVDGDRVASGSIIQKIIPVANVVVLVRSALPKKVIHDILLKQHKVGQALTRRLQVPDRELVASESATVPQVVHQLQGPHHAVHRSTTTDDDLWSL